MEGETNGQCPDGFSIAQTVFCYADARQKPFFHTIRRNIQTKLFYAYSVPTDAADAVPKVTGDHATQSTCLIGPCYPTNYPAGQLLSVAHQ